MGRPKKKDNERRSKKIMIRLTEDEYKSLQYESAKNGTTMSEFAREFILCYMLNL